ncbi:disulfide bond formation protein B [Campylobacter troglodytis]|uniref:disulfide bond formation protein B n=1 Tax=Campylobacter troglodytis TaxID=654363 RepID=UPI00115B4BC8|nr:disulfide bond formation protein B [Campylobacter troglodytis]TQR56576.1 disulfide bond formation protein [Campylobacter troglodytis]
MLESFKERRLWFFIFTISLFSLLFVHYFLQIYLFMKPCVHCVYLRFAMLVMCVASFLGLVFKAKFMQVLSLFLGGWGVFLGLKHSFLLNKIQASLKENNPFGIDGCTSITNFPLSLPLDKLFPSLFAPSGICGLDLAFVSEDVNLSRVQEFFIGRAENNFSDGLYSQGWYLVPKFEFISMAQACMLIFGIFGLCLIFILFLNIKKS